MEEQLEILIKSWTKDSFAYSGKHNHGSSGNLRDAQTRAETASANLDRRLDRGRLLSRGEMGGGAMFLAAASFERPQKSLRKLSALIERVRAQGSLHPGHPRGLLRRDHEAGG